MGWIVPLTSALLYEWWALRTRGGPTLSQTVWAIRRLPAGRVALLSGWAWLTYHFFVEDLDGDA